MLGPGNTTQTLHNYSAGQDLHQLTKCWEKTSLSLSGLVFLVLHAIFIVQCSTYSCVGFLAFYFPTLLSNYFVMLKRVLSLCSTMWLSVTNALCCLKEMVITTLSPWRNTWATVLYFIVVLSVLDWKVRLSNKCADELGASHLAFDTSSTDRLSCPYECTWYTCSVENHWCRHTLAHSYVLPPLQLGSHPPIRQGKLADCDPSATLCLNCSPSACHNERWPVYSDSAFSLPLQLCLYFPSCVGARKEEDLMMSLYIKGGRDTQVIKV